MSEIEPLAPCPECGHEFLHKRTTKTTVSMPVSIRCGLCDLTIEMQIWSSLVKFWNGLPRPSNTRQERSGLEERLRNCIIREGLFLLKDHPHCKLGITLMKERACEAVESELKSFSPQCLKPLSYEVVKDYLVVVQKELNGGQKLHSNEFSRCKKYAEAITSKFAVPSDGLNISEQFIADQIFNATNVLPTSTVWIIAKAIKSALENKR